MWGSGLGGMEKQWNFSVRRIVPIFSSIFPSLTPSVLSTSCRFLFYFLVRQKIFRKFLIKYPTKFDVEIIGECRPKFGFVGKGTAETALLCRGIRTSPGGGGARISHINYIDPAVKFLKNFPQIFFSISKDFFQI